MSRDALHVDPQLSVPSPEVTGAPAYRLYSPRQILAASLLGSALAGAILFALNERSLGRPRAAWVTIVLGVVVIALVMAAGFALGEQAHGLNVLGHVLGFGVWDLAKRQQAAPYRAHLAAGGQSGGNGIVALVTVATVAVIFAIGIVMVMFEKPYGEQLKLGDNSVYFTKGVTHDDAQRVADVLTHEEYFDAGGHADVQLRHDSDGYTLVLITTSEQRQPDRLHSYQFLSERLADALAPMRIEVALADNEFAIKSPVKRRLRVTQGKITIYQLDGATQAEAHLLIDALIKGKIVDADDPHALELRRDGDGYLVSTLLKDGAWDDPKIVATYTEIARVVSQRMGKPVRYRLCDGGFHPHRTVP